MLSWEEPPRRNKLAMLLEDLPALAAFLASPTCMRTTVDVVKALRTFFSGLASMMYTWGSSIVTQRLLGNYKGGKLPTFGTNMQQRATVALRLTLKHMVMIL